MKTETKLTRWGIIGCGGIAQRMAAVLAALPDASLEAVAARDGERAGAFAARFGAARAYGEYASLIADDGIDAVYIATVNTTHFDIARACIEAGKAVLCEKPLTMTAAEAEELFALASARGVLLMEALWSRFLPAWKEARRLLRDGAIGTVRGASIDNAFFLPFDPESRLYSREKGGGILLDSGVYCVHLALYLFGDDCTCRGVSGRLAPTGVDRYAAMLLDWPGGETASLSCGCDRAGRCAAVVYGEDGQLELPRFVAADRVLLRQTGAEERAIECEPVDGFVYEAREFQRLFAAGETVCPDCSPEDTATSMRLLDAAMREIERVERIPRVC